MIKSTAIKNNDLIKDKIKGHNEITDPFHETTQKMSTNFKKKLETDLMMNDHASCSPRPSQPFKDAPWSQQIWLSDRKNNKIRSDLLHSSSIV